MRGTPHADLPAVLLLLSTHATVPGFSTCGADVRTVLRRSRSAQRQPTGDRQQGKN